MKIFSLCTFLIITKCSINVKMDNIILTNIQSLKHNKNHHTNYTNCHYLNMESQVHFILAI